MARHQDLSAPPRGRDWLSGLAVGLVAVAVVAVGTHIDRLPGSSARSELVAWGSVVAVLVTGSYATRKIAVALGRLVTRRASPAAGGIVRLVATGLGYLIILFAVLGVLGVSLGHLLIGAGLTGVVLGIAAQQSLGNIFASLVLLFARPFNVGDRIQVRSGTIGVIDVDVVGIGLTYVTVRTDNGLLKIPNSVMLAAGIAQPDPNSPPAPTPDGDA